MKRLMALACLLPLVVSAATDDYARQWPLKLGREDGGAYRVVLDASVYRQLQTQDLADLDVRNAQGVAVPADVFAPEQPLAHPARRVPLPWFRLPSASTGGTAQHWELVSEADADGHLRRVEARTRDGTLAALPRDALLVDLSRVREAVAALELHWRPVDALDLGYTVEASDDLEHWQPLASRGRLIDLQRDGRRLLHRRIQLFGLLPHYQRARYLRLTPDRADSPLQVTRIDAELAAAGTAAAPQWLELQGRRSSREGDATFEFTLDGRFPVAQVDVALPGNHAVEWRLESRDSADADWRLRAAPWVAYRVDAGARGDRSPPRVLDTKVRDRHWRLSASGAVNGEPVLRLGYRPDVVVFLAEGAPPYTLLAGSALARRADSPLPQLVALLKRRHGADWQPATAYLGTSSALAGEAALQPQRDWRTWLLWAVLALGALVVAGFALSLLRRSTGSSPSSPPVD